MKKTLYFTFIAVGIALASYAQIADTVRLGAGYANQIWYSLENGIVGTSQSKDNWDIAFEITGFTASILANNQKTNFALYKAPYSALQWASVDTSGIKTWRQLYNSDTTWGLGAFSSTANPTNPFDLGWGVYDLSTHYVTGDSCFVVKLSATVYKKLVIDNLANGSYNFTYANIDGSNEKIVSIAKTDYVGKNFAYYDLLNGTPLNREPATNAWDFTFVKYTTMLSSGGSIIPYPVTGILQNNGVKVAQADNITDLKTYNDTTGRIFKATSNEIGYDWKTYDFANNVFKITSKQLFFVKDKGGKYWKVIFTGFASSNGQFSFTKEPLRAVVTGLENENGSEIAQFAVYPNPASGENVSLLFDSKTGLGNVKIRMTDAHGTLIHSEEVDVTNGLLVQEVNINHLKNGIYFLSVNTRGKNYIQKFVKQ